MLKNYRAGAPDTTPDDQLLERYRSGKDARVLGQLFARYMPMVYGVCLNILKDTGKSEDAVMGIYEELVRKINDHEVGNFRGWLYVLSRNYCLMEWRKNSRRPTDYHAPEQMVYYDAVESAFEYEMPVDKAPLAQCLEGLPQQQRRSVELFYFEDKSYKDIADQEGEDVGKIRSFIQNGRRNLKICLEKLGVTAPNVI